ncbi:MAG: 2,3-bisphosphoglycerate-independent phosphoglycerate mutase [candidate division Zixibacteria bacterium]|nr:2,3-bisphosphoglycerate-independent phosphoglycerate mutase [candidate division Zixibacteria bacterium]
MDYTKIYEKLIRDEGGKIVMLVLDGVGGIVDETEHGTELQAANTPNLDKLAADSSCGLLEIVGPGITPGSGPGHLSIFGYDPLNYDVGRGVLSALGVNFDLKRGDVPARVNFATVDKDGVITDRRAGRIDDETNHRVSKKIRDNVKLDYDVEMFFETEKEHRALFVLRGENLSGDIEDTDPQMAGHKPNKVTPRSKKAEHTAKIVQDFIDQVADILSDEEKANMILMRGFDYYEPFPTMYDRYKLRAVCIAEYPMYRGVSKLLGMKLLPQPEIIADRFKVLEDVYGDEYDYYFIHVKKTDSYGEDGNFKSKKEIIEEIDKHIPRVLALNPDVFIVTGDHSTPAVMKSHSWHPVPMLLHSKYAIKDDATEFHELACSRGILGTRPGPHLIGLALAHAGRMDKFGA